MAKFALEKELEKQRKASEKAAREAQNRQIAEKLF